MRLSVFVWREGKYYVAYEPCTGVASQGLSEEEAIRNIKEALKLYLEENPDADVYPLEDAKVVHVEVHIADSDYRSSETPPVSPGELRKPDGITARWTTVEEYARHLKGQDVDPYEKHNVTIDVTELELNALEDLLFTELTPEEQRVLEEIVKNLWHKLVSKADRAPMSPQAPS